MTAVPANPPDRAAVTPIVPGSAGMPDHGMPDHETTDHVIAAARPAHAATTDLRLAATGRVTSAMAEQNRVLSGVMIVHAAMTASGMNVRVVRHSAHGAAATPIVPGLLAHPALHSAGIAPIRIVTGALIHHGRVLSGTTVARVLRAPVLQILTSAGHDRITIATPTNPVLTATKAERNPVVADHASSGTKSAPVMTDHALSAGTIRTAPAATIHHDPVHLIGMIKATAVRLTPGPGSRGMTTAPISQLAGVLHHRIASNA